jgi:peptidoglycan-associated lipoprotein
VKAVVLAGLMAMVACASDKTKEAGDETGTSGSASRPYKSPSTDSSGSSVVGSPQSTGAGGAAPAGGNVIHFEFDSSDINQEGQAVVEAWAGYLQSNPQAKVRLEGHCDERGTPEYNVGLGERRGNAVLQALTARGVGERQLSVTSFGEERPIATGHDESSWSQNRRVELVQ